MDLFIKNTGPVLEGFWKSCFSTRSGKATKYLKLKDVGKHQKRTGKGDRGCKPVLSCPSSLPRGLTQKSAARAAPSRCELAVSVGFVCTRKGTFGPGLSQAQTSVPRLGAAACQRRCVVPNSCYPEPGRCVPSRRRSAGGLLSV